MTLLKGTRALNAMRTLLGIWEFAHSFMTATYAIRGTASPPLPPPAWPPARLLLPCHPHHPVGHALAGCGQYQGGTSRRGHVAAIESPGSPAPPPPGRRPAPRTEPQPQEPPLAGLRPEAADAAALLPSVGLSCCLASDWANGFLSFVVLLRPQAVLLLLLPGFSGGLESG